MQWENIPSIFVTLDISKLDIFNEVNDEQYASIPSIFVTCDASNLDKSISLIS